MRTTVTTYSIRERQSKKRVFLVIHGMSDEGAKAQVREVADPDFYDHRTIRFVDQTTFQSDKQHVQLLDPSEIQ